MSRTTDHILDLLENVRRNGDGHMARCPNHEDDTNSLSIDTGKDGRVLLHCFGGCTTEEVLAALDLTMADLFERNGNGFHTNGTAGVARAAAVMQQVARGEPAEDQAAGCTLQSYARWKQLPEAFLAGLGLRDVTSRDGLPMLRIPYKDTAGKELCVRLRLGLEKRGKKDRRFCWNKKGTTPHLYGLWALERIHQAGYVVLVEGESDTHTLLYCRIPVLGVPGAANWDETWAAQLDDIPQIYVVIENDKGGQAMRRWLAGSRLRTRARLVELGEVKDPSGLYLADQDHFQEQWQAAIDRAVPWQDQEPELPAEDPFPSWRSESGKYAVKDGQSYRISYDRQGEEKLVGLANFAARIQEETAVDDGAQVRRYYTIAGRLHDGRALAPARVPVAKFTAMNWMPEAWGHGPSPAAGLGVKDHLRALVEDYAGLNVPRETIYSHLGWRQIEGRWVYLYAGGAVGGERIAVDLAPELQTYRLPETAEDVAGAMRLSLSFLELGDAHVTFPLWAAVWRAALCQWLPATLLLWLVGETGTRKSTTAALALAHYGGPFDKDTLPASWLDTDNRLEQRCFLAKDTLLVVDDFCPEKHAGLVQEMERRASRLIRGIGNRQGRGRLRQDLTSRATYLPRGMVISTAEQLPNIASSALARILAVPFEADSVDKDKLTMLQAQADRLPHALRGFLEYMIPLIGTLDELPTRFLDLRARARVEGHDRLPETVAHLFLGLNAGIGFAVHLGVLRPAEGQDLLDLGWEVFIDLSREHAKILSEERPTRIFLQAIREGLANDRAWLAHRKDGHAVLGTESMASQKLGWIDERGVYLLPATAYAFASDRLRHKGGVVIGDRALRQMLLKDGLLLRGEDGRLDSRHRCEGRPQRVLWLAPEAVELADAEVGDREAAACTH